MLKDWNRGEIEYGNVVRFCGNCRHQVFLYCEGPYAGDLGCFADLKSGEIYLAEDILGYNYDFCFYTEPDDEDYLGVDLIATTVENYYYGPSL